MYPNFFFFTLCGLFVSDSDVTRFFMFFFGKESFMYPLIKVREVTASKIYLLKIALSSLVRIIWADNKKEMDTASTFYLSIKCSIIHINTDSGLTLVLVVSSCLLLDHLDKNPAAANSSVGARV